MKKLSMLVLSLASTAAWAQQPVAPSPIQPAISISDVVAMNAYLSNLVSKIEELPVDHPDLTVYLDSKKLPCRKKSGELVCNYGYLNDRWNGEVTAKFKIQSGSVVELSFVEWTGNY